MRCDVIVSNKELLLNFEMEREYYESIFEKDGGYLHKIASSIYNRGEDYQDDKIVIQIIFINFSCFEIEKEVYQYIYKEIETNEILYKNDTKKDAKFYVNLDYIKKNCYNKPIQELTLLEKYCLLLTTTDKDKSKEISKGDIVMEKINSKIDELSHKEKIIGLYNKELEDEKIKRTMIKEVEEKAYKNGIEQGIEQRNIEFVKAMLNETDNLEFIAKVTGLSIDKIKEIKFS